MKSYKGKKVAVLGAAIEGLAVAKFLVAQGASVTICDQKEEIELPPHPNPPPRGGRERVGVINWRLGNDYLKNLTDFEIIFRSPGIKYLLPEIQAAKKAGVEISSQIKLFFDLCPAKIIGVTGTKGKGTTSTLIYEILKNYKSTDDKTPSPQPSPTEGGGSIKKTLSLDGSSLSQPLSLDGSSLSQPLSLDGSSLSQPLSLDGRGQGEGEIYLAGNIGTPAIDLIGKLKPQDIVILELSSFQLQDLEKSPHIAVVLNVTQDHLDYHKDRNEYVNAKIQIVKFQKNSDFLVVNEDYETSRSFAKKTKAQEYGLSRFGTVDRGCMVKDGEIIWKDGTTEIPIVKTSDLTLRGEHNWENICAAVAAAMIAGADPVKMGKIIAEFPGLEHRLEFVAEKDGVKYYNDSFSTTPETAIAAIKAFTEPKIVILGGSDKGSDYTELGKEIANSNVKTVILIGEMSSKIKKAIDNSKLKTRNSKLVMVGDCKNMKEIIQAVKSVATSGDVVLLSPACASFGMFKNYKDRGEQFKDEVQSTKY